MSHEITKTDKVFSTRMATWTGLEEILPEYPSRDEAEKLVHDWDVIREPLYRKVFSVASYPHPVTGDEVQEPIEHYELVDDYQLNVRSDNAADLAVVPTERVDVSPKEVWDLAELIQGEDKNVKYETAGSLRGGRDIWILIKLDEPVQINGDPNGESMPYFALQNGYEQGTGLRGQASNIRIVCKNTSRASDVIAEAKGVNFSFRHDANLREKIEEVREALAGWRVSIRQWKLEKEMMATIQLNTQQIGWFVEQFLPIPHLALTSERVKDNVEVARTELTLELFNGMNAGITHTALGVFEAASSWNEHIRKAQTPLTRFKRAMLQPNDILQHAHHLALEAASV